MKRLLESPKLFAVAAILFAIATFVNVGTMNASQDIDSVLPLVDSSFQASPTMPPDPWGDPPALTRAQGISASPTMPPDPWGDPPAAILARSHGISASPTMPPDPWGDPPFLA